MLFKENACTCCYKVNLVEGVPPLQGHQRSVSDAKWDLVLKARLLAQIMNSW